MKKYFAALLTMLLILSSTLTVSAAPAELTLSKPNFDKQWSGTDCEFTIPWSGYYTLTIAGSKGGTYRSTGGNGISLTKKVWLNAGTVVRADTNVIPSPQYSKVGSELQVYGGNSSSLYVNDLLYATAAGGSATVTGIAPSGVTLVRVYNGNNQASSTCGVHWCSGNSSSGGGCYTSPVYATKTESCHHEFYNDFDTDDNLHDDGDGVNGDHNNQQICYGGSSDHCTIGREVKGGTDNDYDHDVTWTDTSKITGYNKACGKENGQILGTSIGIAASTNPNGMTSGTNSGTGYFKIQLSEHQGLKYGSAVKSLRYNSTNWNVILNNDTVVFCKHGNL